VPENIPSRPGKRRKQDLLTGAQFPQFQFKKLIFAAFETPIPVCFGRLLSILLKRGPYVETCIISCI
jgi:hypothetical protein